MNRRNTSNLNQSATVIKQIESELELQERHLSLLRDQREALIACDRKRFMVYHTAYEALLLELEHQALTRTQIMRGDAKWLKAEMAEWPEAERSHGVAILDALRALLADVQQQSNENQVLIANEQRFIHFERDLIIGAIIQGVNYIKTGARASMQMNRLINRTV